MLLHRFATLVAASTAILIFAGGMVKSTESGLAVPDWPNTYGYFMWTFPIEHWVGGIFYEHTHRLIASAVGFLIMALAFWLWRAEPRAWVRRLGYIALAAVIAQGVLGGITVWYFLPPPVSIAHASLAQIVFCLTVTIALVTSRGWREGYIRSGYAAEDDRLARVALATTLLVYAQIVIGATMRHNDAGLAIPDFPLAFGGLVPPQWDAKIAVHYAHRVGALIVTLFVMATVGHVLYHHRSRPPLVRGAVLLTGLVVVQVTLGGLTVLSGRHEIINSLHVVTGAAVLATSLVLTLRAHRARFAWDGVSEPTRPAGGDATTPGGRRLQEPGRRPAGARA